MASYQKNRRAVGKNLGTKDQILIDKAIIRNCKRRKISLAMGWIDYKPLI